MIVMSNNLCFKLRPFEINVVQVLSKVVRSNLESIILKRFENYEW